VASIRVGQSEDKTMEHAAIDHRRDSAATAVETRFFNSMQKHAKAGESRKTVFLSAGSTLLDLIGLLEVPVQDIHLVFKNGRPVDAGQRGGSAETVQLHDGDVVAFSGPVPFNWRI
jgi:hypothetical protein